VDVAQDSIITELDCGTERGLTMEPIVDAGQIVATLGQRILGRTAADDIFNPATGDVLVAKGTLLEEKHVDAIEEARIQSVRIRSPLTCDMRQGCCAACYGRDLARGTPVNIGEAVGVIAAQSIGEPGTQLTMRTFHIGGTAQVVDSSFLEAGAEGKIEIRNANVAKISGGLLIAMGRNVTLAILDPEGKDRATHRVTYGAKIRVKDGDMVKRGQRLAEWDPYTRPILADVDGEVGFEDLVDGASIAETTDETTGFTKRVVIDWRTSQRSDSLKPAITISRSGSVAKLERGGEARYLLSVDAVIAVEPGEKVSAGDVLARIPLESAKTKDITGGLPRVAELFEA
ncbi:MAG: DNA-directed RNA polymerase subunit beta', partial [Devosia nanyangense]|nr:DNA-directed RNA polymerase subunit beta' [Devosia nanyangense]